ncbi:hypothetical protein SAMN05421778_11456 [Sphaerotilus natans]|uniref:hypothetical protein n=1 Tax=Sphaerotilus natans TaxID=34103 RepID=UPI000956EF08|nr:hypothetical protein [Sphaerotilus natans]SIR67543.1 hypothetical protein SAMN05421778_11456 [Sphaerotilus natans]
MITLDTPTQTLHDSGIVAECGLFQLDFSAAAGGTQRIALWPVDIVSGGYTWRGVGDAIKPPAAKASADAGGRVTLELSAANLALLALCMGPSHTWRGRRVTLYSQFLDANYALVGSPRRYWCGTMTRIGTRVETGDQQQMQAVVEVELTSLGTSRARTAEGLRWTPQQHRSRYPADAGLDGLPSMLTNTNWLSKAYVDSQP